MLQVDSLWLPQLQQQQYHQMLNAMSRPGQQNTVLCGRTSEASQVDSTQAIAGFLPLLATLADSQVSVSDPESLISESDWRMLLTDKADLSTADFIIAKGQKCIVDDPKLGSLANPEQSATLIINVKAIGRGDLTLQLTGPGVNGTTTIKIDGLDQAWLYRRNEWCSAFPLGVDVLLCDQKSFIALPRTTQVEVI